MSAVSGFRILCEICTVVVVAESKMSPSVKACCTTVSSRRDETEDGDWYWFYSSTVLLQLVRLQVEATENHQPHSSNDTGMHGLSYLQLTCYYYNLQAEIPGRTAGPDSRAGTGQLEVLLRARVGRETRLGLNCTRQGSFPANVFC